MNDRHLPPLHAANGLADPGLPPGTRLKGYAPTARFGLGENLPSTVGRQWGQWCAAGGYATNAVRHQPALDFQGKPATTNAEIAILEAPRSLTPGSSRIERVLETGRGFTVRTVFYWPDPPAGIVAGYTAPLIRFESTTITGLTAQPRQRLGQLSGSPFHLRVGAAMDVTFDPARHHLDIACMSRRVADQRRDRQRHLHHLAGNGRHGGLSRVEQQPGTLQGGRIIRSSARRAVPGLALSAGGREPGHRHQRRRAGGAGG